MSKRRVLGQKMDQGLKNQFTNKLEKYFSFFLCLTIRRRTFVNNNNNNNLHESKSFACQIKWMVQNRSDKSWLNKIKWISHWHNLHLFLQNNNKKICQIYQDLIYTYAWKIEYPKLNHIWNGKVENLKYKQ